MNKTPDISVEIGGLTFKNPFFVASGPTTKTVRQLKRIEETGWAAASIKLSIDPAPYINRRPRYALFGEKNALAFTAEKRLTFEQGLELVREAKKVLTDLKLFANITYAGDAGTEGWVNMAERFEEAGADVIELNMCCPNMSYNVSLTSGGESQAAKQTGASLGQQADVVAEIVRAIKKRIHIPLFVKLTPEGGQIAQVAHALYAAGADAVGGTANRLGIPDIDIDNPEKAVYHLQDEISMSCYCGGWLKPLALRDTYEIRKVNGMEPKIMAAGGVRNWKDAVETVLCGANLVGVCAETLISGYDIARPMIEGLTAYMEKHGYATLDEFRGKLVPEVKTAPELTIYDGYARIKEPRLSGPCKAACPLHVPVQAYVGRIAEGDFRGAYELIRAKGILQGACAYVCNHPCEDACVRGAYGDPVRIRELKKYVLEKAHAEGWDKEEEPALRNGLNVAVLGAGPKGLSAAWALAGAGYTVSVFTAEEEPGGVLRLLAEVGELPEEVLVRILDSLRGKGVRFMCGSAETEESLTASFDAVVPAGDLSLGALPFTAEELGGQKVVLYGNSPRIFAAAREAAKTSAKVTVVTSGMNEKVRFFAEEKAKSDAAGVSYLSGAVFLKDDAEGFRFIGKNGEEILLRADRLVRFEDDGASVIAEAAKGHALAAALDKQLMGENAAVEPVELPVPVKREAVLARSKMNEGTKAVSEILTDADAVAEASRCYKCGCGEGCHLCETICTDFAPFVEAPDRMCISEKDCVACGMCFNRCPNKNIEMVNRGNKV